MGLVDESKVREAHHNVLVIFEGTTEQAKRLARLDKQENLVLEILGYRGSIYLLRVLLVQGYIFISLMARCCEEIKRVEERDS